MQQLWYNRAYSVFTSPDVLVLVMMRTITMQVIHKVLMGGQHLRYPLPYSLPGFLATTLPPRALTKVKKPNRHDRQHPKFLYYIKCFIKQDNNSLDFSGSGALYIPTHGKWHVPQLIQDKITTTSSMELRAIYATNKQTNARNQCNIIIWRSVPTSQAVLVRIYIEH